MYSHKPVHNICYTTNFGKLLLIIFCPSANHSSTEDPCNNGVCVSDSDDCKKTVHINYHNVTMLCVHVYMWTRVSMTHYEQMYNHNNIIHVYMCSSIGLGFP